MKDYTKFWNNYYKREFIEEASPFARFCQETHLTNAQRIIEFGSGSGRDLRYFDHVGHDIRGYDTSKEAVEHIQQQYPELKIELNDFTKLPEIQNLDAVYSRWTLHSVDDESAKRALEWCGENLGGGGLLLIEVRTVNDDLCGVGKMVGRNAYVTDHYRRFIVPEELRMTLGQLGFEIEYFEESQGFSVYKGDDPMLLRVVARHQV